MAEVAGHAWPEYRSRGRARGQRT
uniref:Uncharacterized protein n=1 Tax=Arundo donax TaxID=35708 RepID=A0A0A8Z615_ARUDO